MSPELTAAIQRVRNYRMTPAERFEQRVSFVYSGVSGSSSMTKDDVRHVLLHGRLPIKGD